MGGIQWFYWKDFMLRSDGKDILKGKEKLIRYVSLSKSIHYLGKSKTEFESRVNGLYECLFQI